MTKPSGHRTTVTYLVLGMMLMLLSNGRWIFPITAWIAPVGWLLFLDRSRMGAGIVAGLFAYVVVTTVMWQGLIPAPGFIYYLITFVYAVAYFLPFVAHRLVAGRLAGVLAALVFPVAWVAIEFIFQRFLTPYGSWFSVAYSQTDYLALLQLASITGLAGISFLMMWFASIVVLLLSDSSKQKRDWRPLISFCSVLGVVLVFGEARMKASLPTSSPVRVAALVPNPELIDHLEEAMAPARRGESLSDAEFQVLLQAADRVNDDLLARTRREAAAGARVIAWSETAGRILKDDETEFLFSIQALAAEFNVLLIVGYGVYHPDEDPPLENIVSAIDGHGNLAWEYQKAHPIVGAESSIIRAGDGIIRFIESEAGRVGAVICHDLDFPDLLLTASDLQLDMVVGPSADWSDITPLHANMARLRAIEGGFSLLRPTSHGRSVATDSFGRELAVSDFADDAMIVHMAPSHRSTIYSLVGDLFAWFCVIGLVGLAVLARNRRLHPSL